MTPEQKHVSVKDMVKGVFAIAFAVSIIFSAVHLATGGSHHSKAPTYLQQEHDRIARRLDELKQQNANTEPCLTLDEPRGRTESFFGDC